MGDKCKGTLEVNGGRVEIFGAARIGCNEGDGVFTRNDGTLIMNAGVMTVYGLIDVAAGGSKGFIQMNGGRIQAFDLQIEEGGRLVMAGGEIILEGNKTAAIQSLMDAGLIQSSNAIEIEYDEQGNHGFGTDKTIVRLQSF